MSEYYCDECRPDLHAPLRKYIRSLGRNPSLLQELRSVTTDSSPVHRTLLPPQLIWRTTTTRMTRIRHLNPSDGRYQISSSRQSPYPHQDSVKRPQVQSNPLMANDRHEIGIDIPARRSLQQRAAAMLPYLLTKLPHLANNTNQRRGPSLAIKGSSLPLVHLRLIHPHRMGSHTKDAAR